MLTRSALRRLVLSGVVAASGLGLFLAGTEGCTTRQCEMSSAVFSGGRMLDDNTWESNSLDEDWQNFSPERYIFVQIPELANRTFESGEIELSVVENPNLAVSGGANNWTTASGNLGEFQSASTLPYPALQDGGSGGSFFAITVHNDTCATYWTRIILHMDPLAPLAANPGDPRDAADPADAPSD